MCPKDVCPTWWSFYVQRFLLLYQWKCETWTNASLICRSMGAKMKIQYKYKYKYNTNSKKQLIYQAFDTVFHHRMKHLEVRQKCSATRRIFNSFLSVSSQWWWNTASHAWYISCFLLFVAFDIRNAWKTVFFDTELWFCYLPVVSLLTLSSIANQDSLLAIILKVSTRHPWHSPFNASNNSERNTYNRERESSIKACTIGTTPGYHLVGPSPSTLLSVICPSTSLMAGR